MVECWSILILPMAMVFALGFYLKRKKLSYTIFGVMLFAYLASVGINTYYETKGNPMISQMGIDQGAGAMEGKETRLGPAATALWSCTTNSHLKRFRQRDARQYDAAQRDDGDVEYANKHLVRRCGRRVHELLCFSDYRCVY